MIRLLVLSALVLAAPVSAQDAGVVAVIGETVIRADGGDRAGGFPGTTLGEMAKEDQAALDLDAGIKSPLPPNEAAMVREIYMAVKSGNGWVAASLLLLLVVGLMRKYGKKAHDMLDDNNPLDKYFFRYIFDTKIGGWVLNWLTAVSGGLGAAWIAGSKIDGSIVQSVVLVSTSATMLIELWDDVKEWWEARKAKKAAEAVAAAAALPKPPAPNPGA